ncbi:ATP-binding protein, partial [Nonomuraea sp. NPDC003201]
MVAAGPGSSWPGVRIDGAGEERGTPPGLTTTLTGRGTELAHLVDAIDGRRSGPRTMLLLGEAGTGKTALLEAAADHARGTGSLVLTARGCEAEVEQSFAALHQLLLPLLPETDDLPEHQREALKAAFGIVAATRQHDPMPLRVGVLNLLARVSRSRPVLLIADDVQHFDRDTRDVLGFVMRRLATHAVTVLLAARGQTPPDGLNPDLPVLSLAPL